MSTVIPKEALKALRKRLPYGYRRLAVAQLAAKGKTYNAQAVSNTLQGLTYVHEIFLVVVAIAEDFERQQKELALLAKGSIRLEDAQPNAIPHEHELD